jgi:hypothetical protein
MNRYSFFTIALMSGQFIATIHHLSRPEDPRRTDSAFLARLHGQIAWVEAVSPSGGHRLRTRLAAALS